MMRDSLRLVVRFCFLVLFAGFWVAPAVAQLPPEETVAALQTADEAEIALYAAEPLITNPAAIDIDTQGRVWVAEIEHYRKPPLEKGADKIKVLEDTDGDGQADRATVFADGVFSPMSICVAGPLVFVATSPDLWLYEDQDGDLKADGPPKKLLTGFGGHNHDHGAHSLVLGPDHKWWMSHGDRGFDVTGTDGSHIQFPWGAVLRGELDGSELETVAVNFRNPYEVCVSSFGESYLSDNDNDGNFSTRICWILPGGNYGWFGRPPAKVDAAIPFSEGWHFRAHIPGFVPGTLVTGFGSPCGICFYEGNAFGPDWKNAPIHTDAGPREVRIYRHENEGAGQRANSRVVVSVDGDDYFRPDDVCVAPDGSLLVSDWYDGGVGGHAYNNPNQGRIYRLTPKGKELARREKPGPYDNAADAIAGLQSPNLATQYLAREFLLGEGEAAIDVVAGLLDAGDPNFQARALWVLDRIGGRGRSFVVERLSNENAAFRALAVRILARHGDEYAAEILAQADDPAVEVRREVLLTLPGISNESAAETLVRLASSEDLNDRYMLETVNIAADGRREMLFEQIAESNELSPGTIGLLRVLDPKESVALLVAASSERDRSSEQRLAIVDALATMSATDAAQAVVAVLGEENNPQLRDRALAVIDRNVDNGWAVLLDNATLQETLRAMVHHGEASPQALDFIARHQLDFLGNEVLAVCQSDDVADEIRAKAIDAAVSLQLAEAGSALAQLIAEEESKQLRLAAARGLVRLQAWAEVEKLFAASAESAGELQQATVDAMLETTDGALVLLRLVKNDRLNDAHRDKAIALAVTHPDSNVRVLFESFLPEDQRPVRLGSAIEPEKILALEGNVERGREIFFRSTAAQCNSCHAIDGVGGTVGPDLSQIGRKYEPAALLETILEPSKAIGPEYVAHLLETDAGQVFVGFVVEQSEDELVLKDARGDLIRTPAAEVVALEPQKKSLMPELVLRDVTAQDAADLLGYLSSLRNSVQHAGKLRMVGPFTPPANTGILAKFGPEDEPSKIDLDATYSDGKRMRRWKVLDSERGSIPQFAMFNIVDVKGLCREKEDPKGFFYAAATVDSATAQEAELLVALNPLSNYEVWINGGEGRFHANQTLSAQPYAQHPIELKQGRNSILIKFRGPWLALAIESNANVQWRTE